MSAGASTSSKPTPETRRSQYKSKGRVAGTQTKARHASHRAQRARQRAIEDSRSSASEMASSDVEEDMGEDQDDEALLNGEMFLRVNQVSKERAQRRFQRSYQTEVGSSAFDWDKDDIEDAPKSNSTTQPARNPFPHVDVSELDAELAQLEDYEREELALAKYVEEYEALADFADFDPDAMSDYEGSDAGHDDEEDMMDTS